MNETQKMVIENRIASYPGETWEQIVDRVVDHVVQVEKPGGQREYWRDRYTWMIRDMYFLPNSPCLRNFGANEGNGAACFVLPIEDSRKSIFQTLYDAVEVQAFGGGTGFNFSALRPKGAKIKSTGGKSTGAVSFISIFDHVIGDVVMQGGVRKGANMGILDVHHPEILEFITAKNDEGVLKNFNLSVGITDEFMEAVECNFDFTLRHEASELEITIKARDLWNKIVEQAWKNGEPGIVFLDTVNRDNKHEKIVATNPCGEQPLPPYTSCVLGSINIDKVYDNMWLMEDVIEAGVRFLDSVIDVNTYPVKRIQEETAKYRNIGLGVMGLADLLIRRGYKYGSEEAVAYTDDVFRTFEWMAHEQSKRLGDDFGLYPAWYEGCERRRNANVTTIAPTGTLSMIADCSPGCEPYFSFEYVKECMDKKIVIASDIVNRAANPRSLVTAQDVPPIQHVLMQATMQKHIDAGISKTINLPNSATKDDISELLFLAHRMGCKGLTVYRDGSRTIQAQTAVKRCPECGSKLNMIEGCCTCENPECGYSACSI